MSLMTSHRGTAALAAGVLLGGLALAGCSAGHAVRKIHHPVAGNDPVAGNHLVASTPVTNGKGTVGAFIARLQAAAATPFEAKYLSGGRVLTVIFYAVRPPDGLLFSESPIVPNGRRIELVKNGSGEYRCTRRGTGQAQWTCQQLTEAGVTAQNKSFASYTAAYWATYLQKVALAARTKATTFTAFTMPPDAPPTIGKRDRAGPMSCIGFRTAGFGVSTVCAPAPGILGSVFLCQGSVTAPMEWYTTSPPASLFQLPPGAKVTRLNAGQT